MSIGPGETFEKVVVHFAEGRMANIPGLILTAFTRVKNAGDLAFGTDSNSLSVETITKIGTTKAYQKKKDYRERLGVQSQQSMQRTVDRITALDNENTKLVTDWAGQWCAQRTRTRTGSLAAAAAARLRGGGQSRRQQRLRILGITGKYRRKPRYRQTSAMSAEHAGKHQRGNRGEFAADATSPSKTSTTSSADLESMLKHALGRIDSLERQHEEMKTSVEIERRALREDISRLKEAHKALQALTERETKALRDDLKSLNRENKALEWSFFQLARKVQEGWEYPVADQPDEYWENKGYDEGAIECLRIDFLAEVETAVSELEHGVCDSITVGFVDHDEDLMPHWNALFQSFDLINPHGTGVVLDFQSIKLNEKVMRKICNHGIRRKNIGKVSFSNVGFANMRGAISELGIALESPKLKSFTWCENPIESTEDMNLFTRVLSQNSALDELEFTKNGNENAHALLSGVDFSTYKILNLSSNSLKTYGRTDIPDLIASNPPLVELDLRKNWLNNDDAVLI
ncbi:hypothetical protein THAOC_35903, partial [Thalassiosira oceanica]